MGVLLDVEPLWEQIKEEGEEFNAAKITALRMYIEVYIMNEEENDISDMDSQFDVFLDRM
jgi:hypothetical protein